VLASDAIVEGYVYKPLPVSVKEAIKKSLEPRRNDDGCTYAKFKRHDVSKMDARLVMNSTGTCTSWLNDKNMSIGMALLEEFERQRHPHAEKIHVHTVDHLPWLFHSSRQSMHQFQREVQRVVMFDHNKNVMSTRQLSMMVINLTNTHWFVLLLYPSLKKIDIINSMNTEVSYVKLIIRLIHIYLQGHAAVDQNFIFNASEWTVCVIRSDRVPQQTNGYDCGVFTLICMEYIMAGRQLDFQERNMQDFRFKLLVSARCKSIPWLDHPGDDLAEADILAKIREHVTNLNGVAMIGSRSNGSSKTKNEEESTYHAQREMIAKMREELGELLKRKTDDE